MIAISDRLTLSCRKQWRQDVKFGSGKEKQELPHPSLYPNLIISPSCRSEKKVINSCPCPHHSSHNLITSPSYKSQKFAAPPPLSTSPSSTPYPSTLVPYPHQLLVHAQGLSLPIIQPEKLGTLKSGGNLLNKVFFNIS